MRILKKQDCFAVFCISTLSILLTWPKLSNARKSYGMSGADTEGTMWWIWSSCKFPVTSTGYAKSIAYPHGFDVASIPFENLLDRLRILTASLYHCDPKVVLLTISLVPTVSLLSNSFAAYFLGKVLFKRVDLALFFSLASCFSPQILLSTRTSLSNNFLCFGFLTLAFLALWLKNGAKKHLLLSLVFLSLQVWTNVYNGALFGFLALGFVLLIPRKEGARRAIFSESVLLCVSMVFGLVPLLRSQFYLLTNSDKRSVYRPSIPSQEVVNFLTLFSRNYSWFDQIAPEYFPRPESGWISISIVLLFFFACWMLWKLRRSTDHDVLFARRLLLLAFVLVVTVYNVPFFSWWRLLFFEYLSPLRGVSNFSKGIPLVIALVIGLVIKVLTTDSLKNKFASKRLIYPLCGLLLMVHLLDVLPTDPTFNETTDFRSIQLTYSNSSLPKNAGPVAHFPDFLYGPIWGMPQRFIQLAQIADGSLRLNGRDFESSERGCLPLTTPTDLLTFQQLLDQGVSRIILHRKLMVPIDFEKASAFLNQHTVRRKTAATKFPFVEKDVYRSLDIAVFDVFSKDFVSGPVDPCLTAPESKQGR